MMEWLMQTSALIEISICSAIVLIYFLQKVLRINIPFVIQLVLLLIVANGFFWPLGLSLELPLAAYVRGVTGDLSITSILLLCLFLLPSRQPHPIALKIFLVVVAIGFYPAALGWGMLDPYAWGYGSMIFFAVVLVLAIICGLVHWNKGVWIIGCAILAWSFHWHESTNLWDYLLDPFLVLWAAWSLASDLYSKRRARLRSGYLFRAG